MNFKAVLALSKTARSAQTHKSISFIRIVWSTLYVYLWSVYALLKVIHPKYTEKELLRTAIWTNNKLVGFWQTFFTSNNTQILRMTTIKIISLNFSNAFSPKKLKSNLIHDLSFYFTPNPFQVPETSQVFIVLGIYNFGFALLSFARKIQKDDLCVIPGPLYVFFFSFK